SQLEQLLSGVACVQPIDDITFEFDRQHQHSNTLCQTMQVAGDILRMILSGKSRTAIIVKLGYAVLGGLRIVVGQYDNILVAQMLAVFINTLNFLTPTTGSIRITGGTES